MKKDFSKASEISILRLCAGYSGVAGKGSLRIKTGDNYNNLRADDNNISLVASFNRLFIVLGPIIYLDIKVHVFVRIFIPAKLLKFIVLEDINTAKASIKTIF